MKKPPRRKPPQQLDGTGGLPASKGHILLLGYEKPVRRIVTSMLTALGYQCRKATGAIEALTLIEAGKEFDLILTDLVNDELGGIGLLEHKLERFPDTPVVLMTTVQKIGYVFVGMQHGAYDFLLMPFERERLSFFVRRAIEDGHLTAENRIFRERFGKVPIPTAYRPKRILVQDDEEPIREIIGTMLSAAGYECHLAETAQETLEILSATQEIDVVLCGILEWTEETFKHMIATHADVPIRVLTAAQDFNVVLNPLRNGAYDFLLKPFEREQLLLIVRRAFEHRYLKLNHDAYSLLM